MKKHLGLLLIFILSIANAQEKSTIKKAKDSIKTEVVNVITSYIPKITDAFKLKQKPVIEHSKETEKKALNYNIISVPVASTFIPKKGVMKKIDLGKKERLYSNYFSVGLGNSITPFAEAYIRQNQYLDSELGIDFKFILSADPVVNTKLSSTFYNINIKAFYEQKERYYTWKTGLKAERNKYNWYGLAPNINYTNITIEAIEEEQNYSYFGGFGKIVFDESYIKQINGDVNIMFDGLDSNEFEVNTTAQLQFPLDAVYRGLNDLKLDVTVNYLGGGFINRYDYRSNSDGLKHNFITFGVHPEYEFLAINFLVKLGAKAYFSLDIENNNNNFFAYPNIEISYPVVKEFLNFYVGARGDLENNSFQKLSRDNPYISPTLNIAQTSEQYNTFSGVKGRLNSLLSYNLRGSFASIENNPFYILNESKSDGTKISNLGFSFFGYEYGNSFNVVYDNIKKLSFSAEISFDISKKLSIGGNVEFNKFTLTNEVKPWNTPDLKADIFGNYKNHKWYVGGNVFFVGNRTGAQRTIFDTTTTNLPTPINLKSYIDVNLNGGYHFNDSFSVFLNLKNMLNNSYQRYTNFNVQAFQAMGGLSWRFDSISLF